MRLVVVSDCRTGPSVPASTATADATLAGRDRKVVGLGAPISVLVRLEPCEFPALRGSLVAALEIHARACLEARGAGVDRRDDRATERQALVDMLASLHGAASSSIEVCWPPPLAHGILRGALLDALASLSRCDVTRTALEELGQALETARACFATWSAFEAVDHGGLP
jgi:hypothetical protein